MIGNRLRRSTAAYLVSFFLAVVAAPHHHLNGIEDLLLDQRSDSGLVTQVLGAAGTRQEPALNPVRTVRDFPCLACFTGDFVAATTAVVQFVATLTPLAAPALELALAAPFLLPAEAASRAPPFSI
ncbi:MAG TPA: hypothetical protein VKG01_15525 [Thermoanaerobaculia bacterium]|nr:hypothetical protein [Thermoanaerobaculia bacterium]